MKNRMYHFIVLKSDIKNRLSLTQDKIQVNTSNKIYHRTWQVMDGQFRFIRTFKSNL